MQKIIFSFILLLVSTLSLSKGFDCQKLICSDVFKNATEFNPDPNHSLFMRAEKNGKLLGYVFKSNSFVDIRAYSGKTVVNLIGIDLAGKITGVKVLKHSEPILLIGIPESKFIKYVDQYIGVAVDAKTRIGKTGDPNLVDLDGVSGATVTVLAEDRIIMNSSLAAAQKLKIIATKKRSSGTLINKVSNLNWQQMIDKGLVGKLLVTPKQAHITNPDEVKKGPWIDLYFAYLNLPEVGHNLLGKYNFKWIKNIVKDGGHAFLVVANGQSSFKGSGFVRGAIFDRFTFEQGTSVYTFRDVDYHNFSDLDIDGAPDFKEGGIFIIHKDDYFSPFDEFSFNFLSARIVGAVKREYLIFKTDYEIPSEYLNITEKVKEEAIWVGVWRTFKFHAISLFIFLTLVFAIFIKRSKLVLNAKRAELVKYSVMSLSLLFIGFYKGAQPSITQLLTLFHGLIDDFRFGLFLSDPLLFIIWWFIFLTIIFWGRGVFCGWICPFGVLSEFSYKVFHKIFGAKLAFEFSYGMNKKLSKIKYVVFFTLLGVSIYSMEMAEKMAEVEPFKTTFLVGLNRPWYFVVYFLIIFTMCLITYRFFCRYLCPLGAAIALPSKFSLLSIKRRSFCTKCRICAKGCHVGAIDELGRIDKSECLYCMDCEVSYSSDNICPILIKDKRARLKRDKV